MFTILSAMFYVLGALGLLATLFYMLAVIVRTSRALHDYEEVYLADERRYNPRRRM